MKVDADQGTQFCRFRLCDLDRVSRILYSFYLQYHMNENINAKTPVVQHKLLVATGVILIIQFVIFLRTTFLPFATFVGGLSFLLFTFFEYALYMSRTR